MTESKSKHTPKVFVATDTLDTEEWLRYRRKGIGGSDVNGYRFAFFI